MVITVQVWMLILSLSGALLPGKTSIKVTVTTPEAGTQTFFAQVKSKETWALSYLDDKTGIKHSFGQLNRTGSAVTLTLPAMGEKAKKTTQLTERMTAFHGLDWATAKSVKIDGVSMSIERSANTIGFRNADGKHISIMADPGPPSVQLTTKNLRNLVYRDTGTMAGWLTYEKAITLNQNTTLAPDAAGSDGLVEVVTSFFLSWMKGDKAALKYLSPNMNPDALALMKQHGKALGQRISNVNLIGFAQTGDMSNLDMRIQTLFTGFKKVFGEFDAVFMVEIDGPKNNGFILLNQRGEVFRIQLVVSHFAKDLIPKKLLDKMK